MQEIDELEEIEQPKEEPIKKEQEIIITLPFIKKHCLNPFEKDFESIVESSTLHLEWLSISKIDNLDLFSNLQILYLQHNKIKKIENLESIENLEYLSLNDNLIETVEGLKYNVNLNYLDVANNRIKTLEDVRIEEIPESIQMVSIKDNPIDQDEIQKKMIRKFKEIEWWNGEEIQTMDKMRILGYVDDNDSLDIDYNYYDPQYQKQIKEEENNSSYESYYEDEEEDEYRFRQEWEKKYKKDEREMTNDGIQQINDRVQQMMQKMKKEGQNINTMHQKRIDEQIQMHHQKVASIRKKHK